jgi:para-aminobenzoate synthetase component I
MSIHPIKAGLAFRTFFFFEPKIVIRLAENKMEIGAENEVEARKVFSEIMDTGYQLPDENPYLQIRQRVSKKEYTDTIEQLKKHILRGDCYEINYCMEFFAENAVVDPLLIYQKLSRSSPNPFSALYKLEDKWLICASPERFLKKEGNKILSQPIKGTSSRFLKDDKKDEKSKEELFASEKDRSENVMVVDLVRNDLARVCKEGTVKVDELFGIYSFPQVHQMISTVSGELKDKVTFTEIIKATFPMGSMTGAPKRRVMELIDQYERSGRGIFSGAVGYITPENDFDFNVVIRSIMYNASEKYLSFMAGSGITFYSDAEKEYEECLLKAEAMRGVVTK